MKDVKGKEKIVDVNNELQFLPNLLKEPIFNPKIPLEIVGNTSVGDNAKRMSREASTSSKENESIASVLVRPLIESRL